MPMYQSVKERAKAAALRASVATVVLFPVLAMADDDPITPAITSLQAKILTYITAGIAACVALLLVSLAGDIGIGVAKKWLRKGAS
ncbi:hypothetical protein [Pseudomonas sp. NBRC 100443]|uniref:hypothetical protein n=1 Tax=Pseudomonas sp. NBRC 100443 TaxID=1113665 RepID=UPI0024A12471|nr:hypothetical protein [Pseudomonas sp. NBRC 100443]GLU36573.1 hypothetical protein Pssp01_06660 [Pseudomonas sp. NBRC 100443]GLU36582.1 hypothetical protein Pssp01_06750 [Pseudomonas sp. NBRC 100443]